MPIDEKTIDLIRDKLEKHEICLTEYGVRLMRIEEVAKDVKILAESVHEMAFNQRSMDEKLDELSTNVKEIKDTPSKNWTTLKTAIISAVGGAIGTGLIGLIAHLIING